MSITDNNRKVEQKATAPRPVGSGQANTVPTHEGSLLGNPVKAGVVTSKTPHIQVEKGEQDQ